MSKNEIIKVIKYTTTVGINYKYISENRI